jgi:hypothetical protein
VLISKENKTEIDVMFDELMALPEKKVNFVKKGLRSLINLAKNDMAREQSEAIKEQKTEEKESFEVAMMAE